MDSTPHVRLSNSGGGYTRDIKVVRTGNSHVLHLRAPTGAIDQICLADPLYVPINSFQPRRLRGAGHGPTEVTTRLLAVLSDVLTLPCEHNLDYALALDWYKRPIEDVAPKDWPNTTPGDLVSRGKYWYKNPEDFDKRRECGRALVALLVPVVNEHPLLRQVDAVAAVPGHDSKVVSFGARLADAVARALGKPLVRCTALADFRTPAKNLGPSDRDAKIRNQFRCSEYLDRQSVVVVDDVYRSGTTADETARALRAAGAVHVASLCAVRTMRF